FFFILFYFFFFLIVLIGNKESIYTYIQYGTGKCILEHGYDDVYLKGIKIKGQSIGLIVKESLHPFSELPFDGIVGLGFADPDFGLQNQYATPLIETIKQQNILEKNIFSFYVPKEMTESGSITFGKAKSKYVQKGKNIEWFPVISIYFWEVNILGIYLFDNSLKLCENKKCRAAIDTGSSLVIFFFSFFIYFFYFNIKIYTYIHVQILQIIKFIIFFFFFF
uniref:Peptidase A1 domain-containing protein n=1 Tax=Piliocolobus tephrosceles TaxID=591936 RepID=A0A8C9GNC3_9PRIM